MEETKGFEQEDDVNRGQPKRGQGKQGRGRSNNRKPRGDGMGCNPNHHGVKRRREEDDDEEGESPPEARDSRRRCHSNVFIRQNVNVK